MFKPRHPKDSSLADISDCAIRIGYRNNLKEYFQKKLESLPSGYSPPNKSVEDIEIFLDNYEVFQAALDGNTLLFKIKNKNFSDLNEYEVCRKCKHNHSCDIPREIDEEIKKHSDFMKAYGDSFLE